MNDRDNWTFCSDSWSRSLYPKLGTLEPIATEQELDDVLAALYKDAKNAKRPQTSEALGLLSQLVGVSPWRGTTPLPEDAPTKNHNEVQLVLVGTTAACVLHIQYNVD